MAKDKTGVFTGAYAINPVNGAKVPIWIADYVLAGYGTGAIMAVPGHDQRDWEFAKQFDLPIIEVVQGGDVAKEAYAGDGEHVNSGFLNGLNNEEAIAQMIAWLEAERQRPRQSDLSFARLAVQPSKLLGRADSDSSSGRWHDEACSGGSAAVVAAGCGCRSSLQVRANHRLPT